MRGGWYQVAYEHELNEGLTPVWVGDAPFVVVRQSEQLHFIDAVCPHRGANLGYGGHLKGRAIVCPFHGRSIAIGLKAGRRFCVREFPLFRMHGLLFVRMSDAHENGFTDHMARVARSHEIVPGFAMRLRCRPELVVENAFDGDHFGPIHGFASRPAFVIRPSEGGEYSVDGQFSVPSHAGTAHIQFRARAFSPHLVVSELAGDLECVVITAATPEPDGRCVVRVSVAMPTGTTAAAERIALAKFLLEHAYDGIASDAVIWENLTELPNPQYVREDRSVIEFERFCRAFDG